MEIQGIPASSTTTYSGDDNTVFGAMQSSLLNIEKHSSTITEQNKESLDYLSKITNLLEQTLSAKNPTINDKSKISTAEIIANTAALQTLTSLISTKQFQLEIKGSAVTYFGKMINMMTNEKSIVVIDKFTKIFDASVKSIANLDKYANKIEHLSQSLIGAMGSFKEIGKGLMFLSGGLALLGITIATFLSAITPESLIMFIGVIGAIRLAGEISEGATWDLAKLSVSIALLGISIWAFTELVDFDMTMSFMGTMAVLAGGMWLLSKVSGPVAKSSRSMFVASGAIAAMSAALWIFGKAINDIDQVDFENVTNVILLAGGAAAMFSLIGKQPTAEYILTGAGLSAGIGGALWVMAWGLNKFSTVNISGERGLELAAIAVAAAGIFALIGNPYTAPFIGIGIGLTAGIGGALWILSKGMDALTTVKVTSEQAENFAKSLKHTIGGLSMLGNPLYAIPIGISTPIALALAASTLGVYGAMMAVSKMPALDEKHFLNFKTSLGHLIGSFSEFISVNSAVALATPAIATALAYSTWMSIKAINNVNSAKTISEDKASAFQTSIKNILESFNSIGLINSVKAGASVPVMTALLASTTMAKGVLWMVSTSRILAQERVEAFKQNLNTIIDMYSSVSSFKLIKATSAAAVVMALSGATMGSITMMRIFSSFNVDQVKVEASIASIDTMLTGMTNVFVKTSDKHAAIESGVEAFAKVGSLTRGLAKSVQSFANLTFDEYDIVNGKMVKVGTTRILPKDLDQVGISIGSILNALTDPLANIGSQKDQYSIGGFTVTNPFSNKVKTGIKTMSKVSSVLRPITDTVLAFSKANIGAREIDVFNSSLSSVLNSISTNFQSASAKIDDDEFHNLQKAMNMVKQLNSAVTVHGFSSGATTFTKYSADLMQVRSTINSINFAKLQKLSMMIEHLTELNRSQGLQALVQTFKEFIEVFVDYTEQRNKEIELQEQRKKELEAQQTQNSSGSLFSTVTGNPQQGQSIIQQNNPFSPKPTEVHQTSSASDKSITTMAIDISKMSKQIEKLYNDLFISKKSIHTVIDSSERY
jgi:hypothetical protein